MTGRGAARWAAIGLAAAGLLAGVLAPASAGPVPPGCDPSVSGASVPGCPSVLLGQVGDVENPTVALPNLSPDVTEVYVDYETIELDQETGQWVFGPAVLNFDTLAQNLGTVPLDLQADDPTAVAGSPVSQCISWTTNLVCRQRASVGGFTWHDEHKHYHFEGFASYALRRLLADGSPDYSAAGLLATSPKVSFCLVDSRQVRDDANPAPVYNTCNPLQEGISPGWTDVYATGLEGQMLSLAGLSNGRYALVIDLDVQHHIYETTTNDNRVVATVQLSKLGTFYPEAVIVDKQHPAGS